MARKSNARRGTKPLFNPKAKLSIKGIVDLRGRPTSSPQRRRPGGAARPVPPKVQRRRPKYDPFDPSLPLAKRRR